MLAALVTAAGGEARVLPTAADTAEALDAALLHAMDADLLLISGGVSAGKFDLVEPALARIGAHFISQACAFNRASRWSLAKLPRAGRSIAAVFWTARQSHFVGSDISAVCRAGAGGAWVARKRQDRAS